MKIYVLSLASDTERRERLTAQLNALQLDFEVFTAIDGRKGLPSDYQHLVDFERARSIIGRTLGSGEAACALSHSLIYEKMLANGEEWAMVLEDDVSIDQDLPQLISSKAYQGCDLLLLKHHFSYVWKYSRKKLFGRYDSYRLLLPCWAAAGYIVSRKGAEFLLSHARPIANVADWPCDITEIGARVCVPRMVHHPIETDDRSNLSSERARPCRRGRFFKADYWKRWLRKRISTRIA